MILHRYAVQPFHRNTLHENTVFTDFSKQLLRKLSRKVFSHEHLVNAFTRFQGLNHSPDSKYIVAFLHFINIKYDTLL